MEILWDEEVTGSGFHASAQSFDRCEVAFNCVVYLDIYLFRLNIENFQLIRTSRIVPCDWLMHATWLHGLQVSDWLTSST